MLKRSQEPRHKGLCRCSRGDTLIELLLAIAVGALVITGLLYGLGNAVLASHRVDQKTTARDLARSQMEYVKSQDYIVEYGNGDEYYEKLIADDIPPGWTQGDIEIIVEVEAFSDDNLQLVTVTVSYDNGSYELQGYKSRH